MSRSLAFGRWLVGLCIAGALAGALLGLAQRSAEATVTSCTCTITGTGHYTCLSPQACTGGSYKCAAIYPD